MPATMKTIIHLFFLLCCFNTYSQSKENQNYILFNSLSDSIVILTEPLSSFEINTNITDPCMIEITHIRQNRPISLTIYTSTNLKYNYATEPITDDIFLVQLISIQSDSILLHKRFRFINKYVDNISKSAIDFLNHCNDSIHSPYMFAFNIFINDKKTNDYEVAFFRTFKSHKTSEYSTTTIYSDSIPVKREGNIFYLSEKK